MALIITSPLRGWASALDSVPDPVFAERMMGDGVAIQPLDDTLVAPCDGEVVTLHEAGHAVCIRSVEGVEILVHVGLDTVALKGDGFEPLARLGQSVQRGDPLIRFDLDAVGMRATSLVTPVIVSNAEAYAITRRTTDRLVGACEELMTLSPITADPRIWSDDGKMVEDRVTLALPHGIHARPAARIGECARPFEAEVILLCRDKKADARSTVALLSLGTRLGAEVIGPARGTDAAAALAAVIALLRTDMGEKAPVTETSKAVAGARQLKSDQIAGVQASPGLAMGPAAHVRHATIAVDAQGRGAEHESAALLRARKSVEAELRARGDAGDANVAAIMRAHLSLLDDPQILAAADRGIAAGSSAGAAWRTAVAEQVQALRATGNSHLIERVGDLLDIEGQVLGALTGRSDDALNLPTGAILIADDLLPSQLIALASRDPAGICLARGGPTSHVAILCAGMGIPSLVAMGDAVSDVAEGSTILLDADGGYAQVAPDPSDIEAFTAHIARQEARRHVAQASARDLCHTRDGVRIEMFANLGNVEEARIAAEIGAEGSGLVRSEFLFLDRAEAPTIEEQRAAYQAISDAMGERPVIIRLLDIGGDKPASYIPIAAEENPALGERGIRVGIRHAKLLEDQLRAILSVQPVGRCRIMIPMVTDVAEVRHVRTLVDRLRAEMGIAQTVEVGIMVETPAAAATADLLAREADFLSIGTNDLTQYVLARDRGNPAVAAGIDAMHPAVLRMIGDTCRLAAAQGRWIGICGGLASDPAAIPILVGLGITELSTVPGFVAEAKQIVRELTLAAAKAHAEQALRCSSAAEVRALARQFQEGDLH